MRAGTMCLGVALAGGLTCAGAQIRTDASLGRPAQTLAGPDYLIPETLGRLSGANLFHSFQTFNVQSGRTASFSTVTPGIANVISRVTGGAASQIDGRIQLSSVGATPDFYFINPAGIVFGAGASLDVPASFFAGTADSVKFPDGRYHADPNRPSTFSSAAPEAFGFLGGNPAAISVKGGDLRVTQGRQLALAGGSLNISGLGYGVLAAPGGEVALFSVAGEGDVGLREAGAGLKPPSRWGDIRIDGMETILVNGTGGKIALQAGNVLIEDSGLLAQNVGAQGGIEIRASGEVVLDAGALVSQTASAAQAGAIRIDAARLSAYRASKIDTSTFAGGNAGTIALQVGDLSLLEGSRLYNQAATADSTGRGGTTTIRAQGTVLIAGKSNAGARSGVTTSSFGGGEAGSIDIDAGSLILSGGVLRAGAGDIGRAGKILVRAGDVELDSRASIDAGSTGRGDAGFISVDASRLVLTQDAEIGAQTTGGGRGGTIQIRTGTLDLSDGGTIDNRPYYYQQRAGDITVEASESIRIRGRGEGFTASPGSDEVSTGILSFTGNISVSAPELTLLDSGGISSRTWNNLNAGNLTANVDRLVLRNGGHLGTDAMGSSLYRGGAGNITVNARESVLISGMATDGVRDRPASMVSGTRSSGGAGRIDLTTPFLRVSDNATINASTGVFGEGGAGGVTVRANAVELLAGGRILSSSNGYGGGGDIAVTAGSLLLDQGSISAFGTSKGLAGRITLHTGNLVLVGGLVNTESGGESKAGDIVIETQNLSLSAGSRIKSDSSGSGDAGNLQVRVAGALGIAGSTITTAAARGNGGAIGIQSAGVIVLDHSQITTSVSGNKGNGGDIHLRGEALVMNTGFIQANTAAQNASGGKVGVDVGMLVPSGNTLFVGGQTPLTFASGVFGLNVIQAAAPTGVSGTIQIASPVLDLSASLSGLNARVIDTGGLGRSPCQTTGGSSLALPGRGGLPPSARGLLRAPPVFSPAKARPSFDDHGDTRLATLERVCL
ncbi:MAG: filamentous hemagglutinin N-terminal domain-containing protein [Betaproteobacteria bacterium]|nr:filamentous hemagglutinin N-terminal domain-containing protein [Betaproteobacteria bacterium]